MELIDKSALVAEIEIKRDRIRKGIISIPLTGRDRAFATIEYEILGKIESFLDTLEVKEADLEKEIELWFDYGLPNNDELLDYIKETAKHFFELGLKAQKGE